MTQKEGNLSSIRVKLPEDTVRIPGIYYFIYPMATSRLVCVEGSVR